MSSQSFPTRLHRRVLPGRQPLARPSDRVEGWALLVLIAVAVLALPLAGAVGSARHAEVMALAQLQRAERHPASAALLADAPPSRSVRAAPGPPPTSEVRATWLTRSGERRVGPIKVDAGTQAGETVDVWLDRAGNPVKPPLTAAQAVGTAIGVAVAAWAGLLVVFAGLFALLRWSLDRGRYARWDREWLSLDRDRSYP